jgi:hypothetical protein
MGGKRVVCGESSKATGMITRSNWLNIKADIKLNKNKERCTVSPPFRADIPAQNLPFQGQLTSPFPKDGRCPSILYRCFMQKMF